VFLRACLSRLIEINVVLEGEEDPLSTADQIIAKVVPLGQRFYPSESAFPLRMYFFDSGHDFVNFFSRAYCDPSGEIFTGQ
jgi:hypothetical protein